MILEPKKSQGLKKAPQTLSPLLRQQVFVTFAGVLLAIFLSSLDDTIVATAMPRILTDLGGFAHYTLVTTAYLITSTVMIPITGRLTDLFGRKWFYTAGIGIFILGSLLSGLSYSLAQLIFFRAFQGIGGGIMIANAFAVVGDLFSPSERGKYQGYIAAVFAMSAVLGPFLGGFITDTLSWHWIFFINVPLGIGAIFLFIFFFPLHQPDTHPKIDYLGVTLLIMTTAPLLLALSWGGSEYPWGSPLIIGLLSFSLVALVIFYIVEVHTREPILPLRYFTDRIVSISMAVTFLTGFIMYSAIIFISLYFQGVIGLSATASGGSLTPMMLGVAGGALISGQLMARASGHYKIQGIIGIILMSAGAGLLCTVNINTHYAVSVVYAILTGFGLGMTLPLYAIVVQNVVPYNVMGVMISSVPFSRFIGGSLGLAVLGSVMNSRFAAGIAGRLPSELVSSLAQNPQALVSAQAQNELRQALASFGAQTDQILKQVLDALRQSLMAALTDVFIILLAVSLLSLLIQFFIKEVPLRKGPAPISE